MRALTAAVKVALLGLALLVIGASPAAADPALPSNYVSQLEDTQPDPAVEVRIEGGDAFFVMEVERGTQVVVPGYDNDEDFSDWPTLEQYLRVQPDGTVQLNRNSQAYYTNAARFGAQAPAGVGPDVTPDWETVATDGRVAWHDHRIHWMSPVPPDQVATDADDPQRVNEYRVPLIIDGELVVAEGTLDYVAEDSPVPIILAAIAGLVVAGVLARRQQGVGASLALVVGGVVTGLLLTASTGRAAGFDVGTPPVALIAVGAVAPALGVFVPNLRESQRRGLVLAGGAALTVFGLLSTGLADGLVGGAGEGFGNWWTNPTLPVDTAPVLLRYAIAGATGIGLGLLAGSLVSTRDRDLAELQRELGLEDADGGEPAAG